MSEAAEADKTEAGRNGAGTTEPGPKGTVTVLEPSRLEQALIRGSAQARATVPTVDFRNIVDMDACLAREARLGCGTAALLIDAAATALRTVPRVNGAYRKGHYELHSRINVGVTIVEQDIFVTPTIFDADQKSVSEIAGELTDYYQRAREHELLPTELTGATFTVLDSSAYDIVALSPMVRPPQAGALAAGPVRDVPVVRHGAVVPGHTMELVLSVDHRIVYGHHAASFLQEVKAHLEEARD